MINVILNDIIEIISGGTPKTSDPKYWENGMIGWLSINDFNNDFRKVYVSEKKITEKGLKESNTKLLNVNDIIISARGTVGALAQIGVPMAFNQSCFGIRGKKNIIDNTYLYYALKNYVANIRKRGQGSVFSTINLNSFKIMEICIEKDYQFQQKIASVLSALDDKIELNNNINAELEQMAKTLYDYWFVQFDFTNEDGKPYKSSGGKMVYNEVLKREIPDGWGHELISDLGTIVGGSTPSKAIEENFSKNGTPWITPKDLSMNSKNKFITRGEYDVSYRGLKDASLTILPEKSVLMSSRAPVGYLAVNRINCTTNQGFKSIVCNKKYSYEYIYYILKQYMPVIEAHATGSTFKEISATVFKAINIIKPNKQVVDEFVKRISPILQKQDNLEQQNQELASLRDWLLPMLMNGQIKVAD